MDACPRIWFDTPAQLAAQLLVIVSMGAALLALAVIC